MKKVWQELIIEISLLDSQDVITTSGVWDGSSNEDTKDFREDWLD